MLPKMENKIPVTLEFLCVGDYTEVYGSDEQRLQRAEHQGTAGGGIRRSKTIEKLSRD